MGAAGGRVEEMSGRLGRGRGLVAAMALVVVAVSGGRAAAANPRDLASASAGLHGIFRLDDGLVLPYPLDNLFRGWTECAGRGRHHKALDIGGVGPEGGLGSAVRAVADATIIQIGMPADDPERFGRPLTGAATVTRGGAELPATKVVPGYGKVHFFTKDYGRHRSGGVIAIRILGGRYAGYVVRYLHLAAVKPGLAVGDEVSAGDELGLLGGTAVLDSSPHLHLSIENARGRPRDVGRIFGIGSTRVPCRAGSDARNAIRGRYSQAARVLMQALRQRRRLKAAIAEPAMRCGVETIEGDFAGGALKDVSFDLEPVATDPLAPLALKLERIDEGGRGWSPRIRIADASGDDLFSGTKTTAKTRRRFAFESVASGRRRGGAHVVVTPKKQDETLTLKVTAWPGASKRAFKGARWRLTIDRGCRQ